MRAAGSGVSPHSRTCPCRRKVLHNPAHVFCRDAQPRSRRKSPAVPCTELLGTPEGAGGGATLSGRLRQMPTAALRTAAADDPLVTKASVDAREAAAKTAAASNMQVEARILGAALRFGPGGGRVGACPLSKRLRLASFVTRSTGGFFHNRSHSLRHQCFSAVDTGRVAGAERGGCPAGGVAPTGEIPPPQSGIPRPALLLSRTPTVETLSGRSAR